MSSSGDEDDGDYVPEGRRGHALQISQSTLCWYLTRRGVACNGIDAPSDEEQDDRADASAVVHDRSVSTDTRVSANWTDINGSTLVSKASADKSAKVIPVLPPTRSAWAACTDALAIIVRNITVAAEWLNQALDVQEQAQEAQAARVRVPRAQCRREEKPQGYRAGGWRRRHKRGSSGQVCRRGVQVKKAGCTCLWEWF